MIKIEELERRIDSSIIVPVDQYSVGLLNMVDFLIVELEKFLERENRLKGIVKIYLNNLNTAFQKIYVGRTIQDTEIFCKILYLFKPLLISEFKRLTKKRLSRADTVITIARKIILILLEQKNFKYRSEAGTIEKVLGKLWENIRHRAKNDALYYLSLQIRNFMEQGKVGKYPLDNFQFLQVIKETVEENALNEATKFTVSTYASNTTHDLEQAMEFQNKASTSLQYGTITNMNTKMDQEVDPKTGVEKTVGEVEVETSDDTSDLKTALEIAGRAFTNPENINVTSITIEKIDEDDMKDSVMQGGASDTLKEEPVEENTLKEEELAQGMWIKTELLDPTAVYYVDEVTDNGVYLIKNSENGHRIFIETDESFVFPWEEVKDETDNADISEPLPEATQLKENEKWVLAIDRADGVAYVQDLRDNTEYANNWDITEDENMAVVFDSEEAANEFKNQFIMQGGNEEKLPTLNMFYAKKLENIEEATIDGTIEQNDETLTIDVDGNEVEKEFRTPEEARVAKAGLENGELTADVMYDESGSWWGLKVSAGDYADWYVTDEGNGVDVTADENMALVFPTEEEAKKFQQENGCEEYEYQNGLRASVTPVQMGITDEEIFGKQEEANMDEKLYANEDPASDDFQQQPVTEEIKDLKVTLGDIAYDVDDEPDFEGDLSEIESILNQLPDTIEVKLSGVDVPEDNAEEFIYHKACEQTGLPIKNATIINIEELEKEEVKEDDMNMDTSTDMISDDMSGLEVDSGIADVSETDNDINTQF